MHTDVYGRFILFLSQATFCWLHVHPLSFFRLLRALNNLSQTDATRNMQQPNVDLFRPLELAMEGFTVEPESAEEPVQQKEEAPQPTEDPILVESPRVHGDVEREMVCINRSRQVVAGQVIN